MNPKMNRIILIQIIVSLLVSVSFGQTSRNSSLEIIPVEQETPDTSLPEIPWVGKDLKALVSVEQDSR